MRHENDVNENKVLRHIQTYSIDIVAILTNSYCEGHDSFLVLYLRTDDCLLYGTLVHNSYNDKLLVSIHCDLMHFFNFAQSTQNTDLGDMYV